METKEIIEGICSHYNVKPTDIGKKKWGSTPEFTYKDIINRIISERNTADAFPELNLATVTRLLYKVFPDKPKSDNWNIHLLGLVGMRKCVRCEEIQDLSDFYHSKASGRYDCKQCTKLSTKHYKSENKEKVCEYRLNNKEKSKEYYLNNKEKLREYRRGYYLSHQAEFKANNIRRYIRLHRATPVWADMDIMNKIYLKRKVGEHTDHIIPLQGKLVCGLHNQFNLRNIPIAENLTKGNKFDPDTYIHELP